MRISAEKNLLSQRAKSAFEFTLKIAVKRSGIKALAKMPRLLIDPTKLSGTKVAIESGRILTPNNAKVVQTVANEKEAKAPKNIKNNLFLVKLLIVM